MIELPQSTLFGRRIPKTKFYENLTVSTQLKRIFVEQIDRIEWRYKIAPSTTNIAAGEKVQEIEVFVLKLNQRSLDTKVLVQIDKEIPYHILFLLEYGEDQQAWISYKEENQTKAGTFKPGVYYNTEWVNKGSSSLKLDGLNMDSVYENLIRQVAGERLELGDESDSYNIKEAISLDEKRQKLMKEIEMLEKKIQNEKQFNRQVEMNEKLRKMKIEMEKLQ
jgi:hypothetical protein